MNRLGLTGICVVAILTIATSAYAGEWDNSDTDITTASTGDRIYADVFRVSGDGGQVSDLGAYCEEAYKARENGHEVDDRIDQNDAAVDAGEELPWPDIYADLPHPGITPNAAADVAPCNGMSAKLAEDPPDPPCPMGTIKAVTGYFNYNYHTWQFEFASTDDWTDARRAGQDSGSWDAEYVCLDVITDFEVHASFDELVVDPDFWKSPHVVGLTGLDTWVWYDFSEPESHTLTRNFTVDADGLPLGVVATIWADWVRWDMDGDGAWEVELDLPDTDMAPATHDQYVEVGGADADGASAGAWLYETKGMYPVTVQIEWRGVYEFVNYPGNDGFYDPLFATSVNDYQVCEVVSVLNEADGPQAESNCGS